MNPDALSIAALEDGISDVGNYSIGREGMIENLRGIAYDVQLSQCFRSFLRCLIHPPEKWTCFWTCTVEGWKN